MIEIIKPGVSTSVQDLGRFGHRDYAVPQSGVLDRKSYQNALDLISEKPGYPVIETFMSGLKLKFHVSTYIGVSGAATGIYHNEHSVELNRTIFIRPGDEIQIKKFERGWITYLAISGIQIPNALGSTSTTTSISLGGIEGRNLRAGDQIQVDNVKDHLDLVSCESLALTDEIQIMKGPEFDYLIPDSREVLFKEPFVIAPQSNRMGFRLNGSKLTASSYDIQSKPVYPGTIQLTPEGPIVLLNDCQTTGGYPRIGCVISNNLSDLSQNFPGKSIRFRLADS